MKKKKPYKYLKFYRECIKNGEMPRYGLCSIYGHIADGERYKKDELFELFYPTEQEYNAGDELWRCFWGADGETNGRTAMKVFTPMRQTIVLLMAAMNGEL